MVEKISVLLAVCYKDNAELFGAAMSSVALEQVLKPEQIVLVKDGTLPDELNTTVSVWQGKLGKKLKVVELPFNQGLGAALRVGLTACDYELVARMDADDVSLRMRFAHQVAFLSCNPDIDVLGTAVQEISLSGRDIGSRYLPVKHEAIIDKLWACPIIHPTVMFRRSRILEAGSYSSTLPRRQDYELWFRCAKYGLRFHNLPEVLLKYRFGEHTHKKQSSRLAWDQGVIGFKGGASIGIPLAYRICCFVPFLRSLLPTGLQHLAYNAMARFDPRKKPSG